MVHTLIFILLIFLQLAYFKVAKKFNIIDRPNLRSSHSSITLRGGGIVFYFGALSYFFLSGFSYPFFYLGLTLMTIVSFLDDVFTLSNKIRLVIHFAAVLLLAYQLNIFAMPLYILIVTFVIVVGVINAYNFMDGINGITASYSIAVGALLMWMNREVNFVAQELLVYTFFSLIIFAYFNFRTRAKCFAGDVGSVAIAYILLFALGALILKTGSLIYILFLAVYGIDTVWTIIRRLYLKENIFEAHRSHLYQYLGNEVGVNKLLISFLYGITQLIIGYFVIIIAQETTITQVIFSAILLSSLSILYLLGKSYVIRKYVDSLKADNFIGRKFL
ncbi:glycosyltransferase family 4 protein [Sphingobacterium oryzagri]|uniref:Glycosyltransferase family 4 protein n=1 Tax=Sphingobacterium oryzagri TaxID=3025669 RepID=A0ABY7WH70_9SPHI|nr:glycosyltransferase family 4 protein [Sphingobacterium sp. KACC 22765]WDF68974.1 glycosyltransferase family 4 protein [Sphingobacterium sp. KACC 22765]